MRIRWSSDLATGVRAIDLQHEELIGILNELNDAHSKGSDLSVLEDVMQRLGAYTVFHFSTEEALMASLPNYKHQFEGHCQQHRSFIDQLTQMRIQSSENAANAMKIMIDFLNEWLYEHILKSDRNLAVLLNDQSTKLHPK